VSNKKSYMDNENIITENFFGKLKKLLGLSSKEEKILKKNKSFMKSFKSLGNITTELEKAINQDLKKLGKKPIKLDRYKLSDFIK
tara:strand:+ start:40 stop:294 length:255 start_codon:yes stop_codon:yes gene_type:complete